MSLEIKVEPSAIKSLTEEARNVPNKQIDRALTKLENLENTLSSWKGDGKAEHDAACADLKNSLTEAKHLMNAILAALDQAVDEFSEADEEISSRFNTIVEQYTSNR